ncbi:hypothetical protein EV385_6697 [Krasilnikovia cinnamomea]|uniref:Uncharacterized protein n=1 Tax=Krasilnikovia cinnamomea TaxID=349313 RepID=A0A4Q7Z7X9_9ACTN|nr:hypothetical protein [Krasilnikovia cinnamomea]RZU46622.1 hypothetical protein EV385_6697 [Krasilnikovia cinnamomea]
MSLTTARRRSRMGGHAVLTPRWSSTARQLVRIAAALEQLSVRVPAAALDDRGAKAIRRTLQQIGQHTETLTRAVGTGE